MNNKRLAIISFTVAALLAIPLIAMQFTSEVNWDLFDFIVMGVLLFSTGLLIDLALRKVKTTKSRFILCSLIIFLFLLVYVELAVGIFGSPIAGS